MPSLNSHGWFKWFASAPSSRPCPALQIQLAFSEILNHSTKVGQNGCQYESHWSTVHTKTRKFDNTQGKINAIYSGNTQGIAHTRWATHGGKTDANSHPHFDMRGQIAVVHNGTISNYSEIKAQLAEEGVTFKSQTDTEVIAQLIGKRGGRERERQGGM